MSSAASPAPITRSCSGVCAHADDQDATAYVELPDIGTPDERVTTVIETDAYLPARDAAIAVNRSQPSPFDGLPEELRRAFLAREHLTRVNPRWAGGDIEHELLGLVQTRPGA